MNRTNRTSDFRLSGVKAGVRALPDHRAPYIRGGMGHKSALICYTTHFSMLLYLLLTYYYPARSCRYRGKGQDGSDPPLFAASPANMAGGWGRGCYMVWGTPCPPPPLGSLPSDLSLREGSEHGPQAGADVPQASPMKWRYPILISAGLCCSAWGFLYRPFPLPGDDPMLDLVLYHTPPSTPVWSADTTPCPLPKS